MKNKILYFILYSLSIIIPIVLLVGSDKVNDLPNEYKHEVIDSDSIFNVIIDIIKEDNTEFIEKIIEVPVKVEVPVEVPVEVKVPIEVQVPVEVPVIVEIPVIIEVESSELKIDFDSMYQDLLLKNEKLEKSIIELKKNQRRNKIR